MGDLPRIDVVVVSLSGDLDLYGQAALHERLGPLFGAPAGVIDLLDVRYADSSALSEFALVGADFRKRGARGAIVTNQANLIRLLEIVQFTRMFFVCRDVDAAIRHVTESAPGT